MLVKIATYVITMETIAVTIRATYGVWNRPSTLLRASGTDLSNDQANMFRVDTNMYGTTLKNIVRPTPKVIMKIKMGLLVKNPIRNTGNPGPRVVGYGEPRIYAIEYLIPQVRECVEEIVAKDVFSYLDKHNRDRCKRKERANDTDELGPPDVFDFAG